MLALLHQTVKCLWHKQGATARLSGWWRGEGLVGTGGRIVVRYLGPGGAKLRDDAPLTANGTFGWKPFAHTLKPPATCGALQVFLARLLQRAHGVGCIGGAFIQKEFTLFQQVVILRSMGAKRHEQAAKGDPSDAFHDSPRLRLQK